MIRYKELVDSWREGAVASEPQNRPATPEPAPVPEAAPEAMREASLADAGEAIERDETVSIGNTIQRYRARRVALLDADVNFAGSYGVFNHVTHLNTSRRQTIRAIEHSDLLIRSLADWIWETDAKLAVVTISRGISAITGLPPKLLSGLSLRDLGSFDEPATGGPTTEEIFCRRTPFRNLRYRMIDTEGRERHLHLIGMPVFADEGRQFSGYHGTATEITAQIEAEADAAASRSDVDQAMKALVERNKELDAANEKCDCRGPVQKQISGDDEPRVAHAAHRHH